MIVWLNGPFGVGKSSLALELHRRLPGSFLFDPEEVGYLLRRLTPRHLHLSDFQDEPLWRELTANLLKQTAQRNPGPVLVPMTIVNPTYVEEIIGSLRADGLEVHHFALLASRETILRRLRRRGARSESWPARRLARCLAALQGGQLAEVLDTENRSIPDLAAEIAGRLGLELGPRPNLGQRLFTCLRPSPSQVRFG